MTTIWQVRLFNGPILLDAAGTETRRFRSHKVGALLAYLALNLGRPCPREELYEALWPEEETHLAANRFRVTLASLRRHLEPPGIVFGAVLDVSEPGRVRLRTETVGCDTIECERLLRGGHSEQAARLVTGPLLPGFYEEWAIAAQARYEMLTEDLAVPTRTPVPHTEINTSPALETPTSSGPAGFSVSDHNATLPLYLTRFFGRERELQALRDLLQAHRQVSLIGMGGMGKNAAGVGNRPNVGG